jgi:hypothetical protein
MEPFITTIAEPWIPTLIIFLVGLSIGSFFVSLYSDASKAIYISFLTSSGNGNVPDELREFL